MALLYLVPSAKDSYLCLAGMHMCPAFTPRLTLKGGRTSPKLPRMQGQSSFVSCGMLADHLMQVIGLCSACTAMYELYPKAHGVIKAMCFFKQTARLHGQTHPLAVLSCLESCCLRPCLAWWPMSNVLQLAWTYRHEHSKLYVACVSIRCVSCLTDFQPNKAPPLSSVAVAAGGDIFTAEGPKPHSTPQALDKAGILKVGISLLSFIHSMPLDWHANHVLQTQVAEHGS